MAQRRQHKFTIMRKEEFLFRQKLKNHRMSGIGKQRDIFEQLLKDICNNLSKVDRDNLEKHCVCQLSVYEVSVQCSMRLLADLLYIEILSRKLAHNLIEFLEEDIILHPWQKEQMIVTFRYLELSYQESWGDDRASGTDFLIDRLVQEMKFIPNTKLNAYFAAIIEVKIVDLDRIISSYKYDGLKASLCSCSKRPEIMQSLRAINEVYSSEQKGESHSMEQLVIFLFWTSFFNQLSHDISKMPNDIS